MEYTSIELKSEKNSDRLKEITDRLEQGVTELFESDRYKEYLQVMARFLKSSKLSTLPMSGVAMLGRGLPSVWLRSYVETTLKCGTRITVSSPSFSMVL